MPFVHKDRAGARPALRPARRAAPAGSTRASCSGRQIANEVSGLGVDLKKYAGSLPGRVRGQGRQGPGRRSRPRSTRRSTTLPERAGAGATSCRRSRTRPRPTPTAGCSTPVFIMFQLLLYDGPGRLEVHQHRARRGGRGDRRRTSSASRSEYFTKENRTVGMFLRKAGAGGPGRPGARQPARRGAGRWCGRS